MKYYLDTEFLEGKQKEKFPINLFRKETPETIDLISVGIVAEDGREYYAISKDFNLKEAWNRYNLVERKNYENYPLKERGNILYKKVYWIRENVLKPIFCELRTRECLEGGKSLYPGVTSLAAHREFTKTLVEASWDNSGGKYKELKRLINKYGKTNKQIAEEVKEFVYFVNEDPTVYQFYTEPKFYAYYADYDWVVFCWLFGKMINLPKGFPMYCIDLKQIFDDKMKTFTWERLNELNYPSCKHDVYSYLRTQSNIDIVKVLKNSSCYPKQTNEHNALADAKWNKKLHEFLIKINNYE